MPYALTADDYQKFTQDVLAAGGDQATLTTILVDMQSTVNGAIESSVQHAADMETIRAENTRLKESNMNLFLTKIGTQLNGADITKQQPEPKKLTTEEYMNQYFAKLK